VSAHRLALAALALLCIAAACRAADTNARSAILIEARPDLPDPNFRNAVVLVMNNLGPAPAGLIVNRPTRVAVAKLFPDEPQLARVDDKLYFGGPVDVGAVSFVFRASQPPEQALEVLPGVFLSRDRDLLRSLLARERPTEGLRIFLGYAGWGPGQLEGEIGRGDWKLAPADAAAIFAGRAEHPWPDEAVPEDARRI
jgi:putative transcriptional regulator